MYPSFNSNDAETKEASGRRDFIARTLTAGLSTASLSVGAMLGMETDTASAACQIPMSSAKDDFHVANHRIRQSVMGWCYKPMEEKTLFEHCAKIGIEAVEGIDSKFYPEAIQKGLKIALVGSHGFATGPTDRSNHAECIAKLTKGIQLAVEFNAPSVITFTGMRVKDMLDGIAERNCIDCWKQVIELAESKKITLVLEHLNSRDSSHPMKGHPGYFGDDVDRCFELVKKMDSPYFKLLFDIYHVQIMNGDVIRRIEKNHAMIGHYHTAGCPGRGEMDDSQEINYPPILNAILKTGYKGFVAQEFIPTWKDPVQSLRHGAIVMDV